ncbi:MAG: YebC/PmpR family DNA-binding transcriptional regulator [Eubacteriales bacterium]|nr:YebC/PmpR family DNA-binding transcriptional regulator [Eubacteriales bacterium]
MSGHSKWANIKHKKEKSDSHKGKVFTKLGREIAVCVKQGGPDPEANSKLKDVIAKAKAENMPNDNIERSIKKAAGDMNGDNYEEIVYEGYGPEGVALIIESMTDNRNRTAGDLRFILSKHGGNLGASGCVSFLFNKKGIIIIEKTKGIDEDELMLAAIDAGAEDVVVEEEYIEIITDPSDFYATKEELEKSYKLDSAEVEMVPVSYVQIKDEKNAELMDKLIEALEDHDDVQNVYHNWESED